MKNIELEFRSEVSAKKFGQLLKILRGKCILETHTKRLSIMFLGVISKNSYDIRIRVNNKRKAEIVLKKGDFHAHDRVEIAYPILKKEIIPLSKIFQQFNFNQKVTERETFKFDLHDKINIALARANKISYIEIEKMSDRHSMRKDKRELLAVLKSIGIEPIKSRKEFDNLCNRLTKKADWIFRGSKEGYKKLESKIMAY